MKIIKKQLIEACKQVLREYVDNTHVAINDSCVLCQTYREGDWHNGGCGDCLMEVFDSGSQGGCLRRKCTPIDSRDFFKRSKETKAVIEFYKLLIGRLETMTAKEMNKPNAFKFLIELDNQVANKYEL